MQAYQSIIKKITDGKPKISRFVDFEVQTDEWTKRLNISTLSRVLLISATRQTESTGFWESFNLKSIAIC